MKEPANASGCVKPSAAFELVKHIHALSVGGLTYKHEPLPSGSIRLLKISHDEAQPTICSLAAYEIDKTPPYYALSYCWGDADDKELIKCNGSSLAISQALAEALKYLKAFPSNPSAAVEHFWVDQICINQADATERGHQVSHMRDIYQRAHRVLAWLGTEDGSTKRALPLLELVCQAAERWGWDTGGVITTKQNRSLGLPDFESEDWVCLKALFGRPWFSRIWVAQEAIVNRVTPLMVFGHQSFPLATFGACIEWLYGNYYPQRLSWGSAGSYPDLVNLVRRARKHIEDDTGLPKAWSFGALLSQTRDLRARDPRDQVYALLGLTRDEVVVPDYEIGMLDLYAKVARFHIARTRKLDILRYAGGCGDVSCPSWVPRLDLSIDIEAKRRIFSRERSYINHDGIVDIWSPSNASKGRLASIGSTQGSQGFGLHGVRVGHVVWCTPTIPRRPKDATKAAIRHAWESSLEEMSIPIDFEDQQLHDFARTFYVMAVSGFGSQQDEARFDPINNFWCWLRSYYRGAAECVWTSSRQISALGRGGDARSVWADIFGRKIFITDNGYLGYGSAYLERGDQIYVLFGGNIPLALRQQEHGHEYIGEAYIADLMEGQAVTQCNKGLLKEETVVLI